MNINFEVIILLFSTLTSSIGALLLKKAMDSIDNLTFKNALTSIWIWCGVLFYIIGSISNIVLLKFLPYSVVFPMTSLIYVWTLILSYVIFKESFTKIKLLSVFLIVLGVYFIGL